MEVIHITQAAYIQNNQPHVMAIGFFDGVHLGHQRLFSKAKKHARKLGCKSSALTFSPHPDEVIKGHVNRKYITPLQEKIDKIGQCGIDTVYVMKFDKEFASLPPMDFIDRYITGTNAKHIVVGFDFTFGFKAEGTTTLLKEQSEERNYGLSVIPKMTYLHSKIGSTETKALIQAGNVADVPKYLGAHYEANGYMIEYDALQGKGQIQMHAQQILPEYGTFLVEVTIEHAIYEGRLTIGTNQKVELEVYHFEWSTNQALKLKFLNKIALKQAMLV